MNYLIGNLWGGGYEFGNLGFTSNRLFNMGSAQWGKEHKAVSLQRRFDAYELNFFEFQDAIDDKLDTKRFPFLSGRSSSMGGMGAPPVR